VLSIPTAFAVRRESTISLARLSEFGRSSDLTVNELIEGPEDVTERPIGCLLALPARHGVSEARVNSQKDSRLDEVVSNI
jgi:hypothetical protein